MGLISLLRHKSNHRSDEGSSSCSLNGPDEVPVTASYLCSLCKNQSLRCPGKPLRMFFYEELKAATRSFSFDNFLAEAGFGHVFRGVLEGGNPVAVKILSEESVFNTQRSVLDRINSPYIVGLIGYCDEVHGRKFLVYDYICNGSLSWHLTFSAHNTLPWTTRKSIAITIARGLDYLHNCCCIEHRDLSSQNILLTHDFNPMIAGMTHAKLRTGVADSHPYSARQQFKGQEKSDIYSFGVILLELISSRRAYDLSRPSDEQVLTEWVNIPIGSSECVNVSWFQAAPLLRDFDCEKLLDPSMKHQHNHYELLCMMTAASLCLKNNPSERPPISRILNLLVDECERDDGDRRILAFSSESENEEDNSDHSRATTASHASSLNNVASVGSEKRVTWAAVPAKTRSSRLSYNVML